MKKIIAFSKAFFNGKYLYPLLILGLIFVFKNDIFLFFKENIYPLFDNLDEISLWVFTVVLSLVSSIYFAVNIWESKRPKVIYGYYLACFALVYVFIFRNNSNEYVMIFVNGIYFIDVILLSIVLLWTPYYLKGEKLNDSGPSLLIGDMPLNGTNDKDDILGINNYARHIASFINKSHSHNSISIALNSEWGYGKTSFMNYIKTELICYNKENDDTNVIIEFNPWKYDKQDILKSFYETIESNISEIDNNLQSKFKDYFSKISDVYDNQNITMLNKVLNIFNNDDKSIEKNFLILNETIERSGKRLVIFIDDVDRLIDQELVLLLKLIRNTADFRNTVFIVAFDHRYVAGLLKIAEKDNYLQKIFQLQVVLPPINKVVIKDDLIKKINRVHMDNRTQKELDSIFDKEKEFGLKAKVGGWDVGTGKIELSWFLKNIRDVKRFANSFNINYWHIGSELELYDFLMMELIKYSYYDLYKAFSNGLFEKILNGYIAKSPANNVLLDDSEYAEWYKLLLNCYHDYFLNENLKEIYVKVADDIFSNFRIKNSRSIIYKKNIKLYFSYDSINLISIKSFNDIKTKTFDEQKKYLIELRKNIESYHDLLSYLKFIPVLENKVLFESFIRALCFTESNEKDLFKIGDILFQEKYIIEEIYNGNQLLYFEFLNSIYDSDSMNSLGRLVNYYQFFEKYIINKSTEINVEIGTKEEMEKKFIELLVSAEYETSVSEEFMWNIVEKFYSAFSVDSDYKRQLSIAGIYKNFVMLRSDLFLDKIFINNSYIGNVWMFENNGEQSKYYLNKSVTKLFSVNESLDLFLSQMLHTEKLEAIRSLLKRVKPDGSVLIHAEQLKALF